MVKYKADYKKMCNYGSILFRHLGFQWQHIALFISYLIMGSPRFNEGSKQERLLVALSAVIKEP